MLQHCNVTVLQCPYIRATAMPVYGVLTSYLNKQSSKILLRNWQAIDDCNFCMRNAFVNVLSILSTYPKLYEMCIIEICNYINIYTDSGERFWGRGSPDIWYDGLICRIWLPQIYCKNLIYNSLRNFIICFGSAAI